MAEPSLFTADEVRFVRELRDDGVEFLVVGLSAAALQGAPAVTQDIDLWFRDLSDPRFQEIVRRVGATYVPPSITNPPLLVGSGVALFDLVVHMHGLRSFDEEYAGAIEIEIVPGVSARVLPLERIVASKRAAGRDKDLAILPVLEDALRTIRDREGSR